jgi:hypothetical protein
MTYLKDIKLCVNCTFYGTPQGQRDRCINPSRTVIDPVKGGEIYPLCISERTSISAQGCGNKAQYFVLDTDAEQDRLQRLAELDEVMRDAPTL